MEIYSIEMGDKLENLETSLFMNYITKHDEASFKQLFKVVDPWLYRMVYRMIGNKSVAHDIVQQTWLTVIETAHAFDTSKGSITGYVHAIAKNNCLKWLKDKSKIVIKELNEFPDFHAPEDGESDELKDIIRKSIDKIKNKNHLDALLLYYFAELKISEIKTLMNTSEQNVKVWLHRGRNEFAKEVKKYYSGDSIWDLISSRSDNQIDTF